MSGADTKPVPAPEPAGPMPAKPEIRPRDIYADVQINVDEMSIPVTIRMKGREWRALASVLRDVPSLALQKEAAEVFLGYRCAIGQVITDLDRAARNVR